MNKMSLITFEATGHVLGAFTRTADPEGDVQAADVVGDELLLRDPDTGATVLRVPASQLLVETVDRLDQVILLHRSYVVEDGLPLEQGNELNAGAVTYNSANNEIEVALPFNYTEDTEGWIVTDDLSTPPVIRKVAFAAATSPGTAAASLQPGDYGALVVAPGFKAFVEFFTVV